MKIHLRDCSNKSHLDQTDRPIDHYTVQFVNEKSQTFYWLRSCWGSESWLINHLSDISSSQFIEIDQDDCYGILRLYIYSLWTTLRSVRLYYCQRSSPNYCPHCKVFKCCCFLKDFFFQIDFMNVFEYFRLLCIIWS